MVSRAPGLSREGTSAAGSNGRLSLAAAASLVVVLLMLLLSPAAEAEFEFLGKWGSYCNINTQVEDDVSSAARTRTVYACEGRFHNPQGIAADSSDNVYIADTKNIRIQKFGSSGRFLTSWGGLCELKYEDSEGTCEGSFTDHTDVSIDRSGQVYILDEFSSQIQKYSSTGRFIASVGSKCGIYPRSMIGNDCDGKFYMPKSVAVGVSGTIYVVDRNRIQKLTDDGRFLGKWEVHDKSGSASMSTRDIAVGPSGNLYVLSAGQRDDESCKMGIPERTRKCPPKPMYYTSNVQKFDPDGRLLGGWDSKCEAIRQALGTCAGDGLLRSPSAIAVDRSDNIYIMDTGNHRIQRFDSSGRFLGKWGSYGDGDGQFKYAAGIAVDQSGDIYVADSANDRIQKFRGAKQIASDVIYKDACNFKVTSPRVKMKKKKRTRVSAKKARRLFTHGAKGYIKWGKAYGQDVICKKVRMTILQKRGKRYYIPGTKRRVPKKYLTLKSFPTKGIRYLKRRKVGKLRQKRDIKKSRTKISFKDFNRYSKLGRRALRNLGKKRYRGTYIVLYTVQVDGVTVKKTTTLKVKRARRS